MRFNGVRQGVVAGMAAVALLVGSRAGASDQLLQRRVDLFLKDADLLAATQALSLQTGLQFVIAPTHEEFNRINLRLMNQTAEEAIRHLCEAAGAYAERDESGVFIIRRGPRPASPPPPPAPPVRKPSVRTKIHLLRADPRYVFEMLTNRVVHDPASGILEMQRYTSAALGGNRFNGSNLTVISPGNFGPTAYPVAIPQSGGESIVAPPPQQLRESLPTGPTGEAGNGIVLPGEGAGQLGGAAGGGGQAGGGQAGGGAAGGGATAQLNPGQGLVPDGLEYIGYDPTDNSIVVVGPDDAVRELQQAIALFDVAPRQVIIKVEFVTTSNSYESSLGIDWQYQRGAISTGNRPGSFVRSGDPIFINYATGNVVSRLRTLLTGGSGRVVNAPLIRTLNNQFALVAQQVQTTIFINQVVSGPGGIITVPNPVSLTTTTQLAVRPRINNDGTITVFLTPQIQDFGGTRRGPDGQEIPDVLSQVIQVVARVRDGETIVLAGLTRKSINESESRYPVLADLPIIGQFFRSKTRRGGTEELLIFVTPKIVAEDEALGVSP